MVVNPLTFQIGAGNEAYDIKLEIFEGPLDLLLFLIRKEEIDIYDIPIARIARQFLEYVEIIQTLNLEQAGDFLVMAATLMKIKSRMLLPVDPEAEEAEGDPREELIRRLLEYQQFKEVASWMEERQEAFRSVYYRGTSVDLSQIEGLPSSSMEAQRPVGLFDLLAAFKQAMDAAPKIDYHDVQRVEVSTEERAQFVLQTVARRGQTPFLELVSGQSRIILIVTFVAILELIRAGQITARQSGAEGEIWLYNREEQSPEQDQKAPLGVGG